MSEPATEPATGDVAPQQQATPATPAAVTPDTGDSTDWKTEAEKWKGLARKHEGQAKGNVERLDQQDATLKAIADKLGLDLGSTPDPAKLSEQLDHSQREARQHRAELAVYRAATSAGADADALLDSRSFMAGLDALDPSGPDYGQQVTDAVKAWADTHPRTPAPDEPRTRRQQPPVPRPSAEFGAQPRSRQWTKSDVDRATPAELDAAIKDGLLVEYGIGKPKASRYGR